MNGYNSFFTSNETHRVDIGEDEWVDIKKEMSMGDWEEYESSMLQADVEQGMNREARRQIGRKRGDSKTNLKLKTGDIKLLEINIVAWSFQNVVVDSTNISRLKEPTCRIIIDAISDTNGDSPLVASTK